MKAHAFAQLIEVLTQNHSANEDTIAKRFSGLLRNAPATTTVAAAVAMLRTAIEASASNHSDAALKLGALGSTMERAKKVVSIVGTKASIDDCALVAKLVADFADADVAGLTEALVRPARTRSPRATAPRTQTARGPNQAVVDRYVAELRAATPGTMGYELIVQTLKADTSAARAGELRAIAAALGVELAVGATRAAAFKALERGHRIVFETNAKADALKGQTAT